MFKSECFSVTWFKHNEMASGSGTTPHFQEHPLHIAFKVIHDASVKLNSECQDLIKCQYNSGDFFGGQQSHNTSVIKWFYV